MFLFIILFSFFHLAHFEDNCRTIYDCMEKDENGFTIFPSFEDGQNVYVSSSTGSDDNPGTESLPLKTVAAGVEMLRTGYPDTLLFMRGDEWNERLGYWDKGGRSCKEPMVLRSYGDTSKDRPVFNINGSFVYGWSENTVHIAFTEMKVSGEFTDGGSGVSFLGPGEDLLFEDMFWYEAGGLVFQVFPEGDEAKALVDIYIHKCILYGSYPRSTGHSQGMYSHGVRNFYILDTFFYHNGWTENEEYIKKNGVGHATMFNHNSYLNWEDNLVIKNCLYLRGASMNMKFRNDHGSNPSKNLLIEDNFIFGGELGIGLGGNTDERYRFIGNKILNNVFSDTGETLPSTGKSYTNRSLSWMLGLDDNLNTVVSHNLFIRNNYSTNGYAVSISGTSDNIKFENNIAHGLIASSYIIVNRNQYYKGKIFICRNNLQHVENISHSWTPRLLRFDSSYGVFLYENNYYSTEEYNDWFNLHDTEEKADNFIKSTSSTKNKTQFYDSSRSLLSYTIDKEIGETIDDFIAEAAKQSKYNWRIELTATKVNDYLREGFGVDTTTKLYSKELEEASLIVFLILLPIFILILIIVLILLLVLSYIPCLKIKSEE